MKFTYIFIISIFLFATIAGCIEQTKADDGRFIVYQGSINTGAPLEQRLTVVHDTENNITLYITGSAITAVPDYELKKPANYIGV